MTRTHDLLITNQLLYRLSYISIFTFGVADLILTNQLLYQLSYTSLLTFCGTPLSLSLATISDLLITKCIRALHLAVFRAFGVFPLDTFRVFQPTRSIVSIRSFPRVGQRVGQAPLPCTEVFPMIIVHILRRYMC